MNEKQIIADAIKEFQKRLDEANKKLMRDMQQILKDALKDAERLTREKDDGAIDALEKEMDNL